MSWKAVFENPAEKTSRVIAAVWRVRLDSRGYNSRGQYFGLGQPLYSFVAQDSRGRYVAIDHIRATNLRHAKDLIRRRLDKYEVRFTR